MTSQHKKKSKIWKSPTDDLWTKKWVTVKEDDLRFDLTATQQKRWAKIAEQGTKKKLEWERKAIQYKIQAHCDEKLLLKVEC
jgi:hypothetical protein